MAKKIISLLLLLSTFSLSYAGRGGGVVVGSLFGGMAGSMLGSAISRPRHSKTVVVSGGSGDVRRADFRRLEDAVRFDLNRLNDKISDNENDIRELKDLRSSVKDLDYRQDRLRKKVEEVEAVALTKREKQTIKDLSKTVDDLKDLILELGTKIDSVNKRVDKLESEVLDIKK